jgi:DNA-binding transcriptional ArsR family regulator
MVDAAVLEHLDNRDEGERAKRKNFAPASRKLKRPLDRVLDALADPTRRAIFEHLTLGESTVHQLVRLAGITQQAVAKHLEILERARLVTCRRSGGRTPNYYRGRPGGATHLFTWLTEQGVGRHDHQKPGRLAKQSDDNSRPGRFPTQVSGAHS